MAGEARKDGAGNPLSGRYRETYWCCQFRQVDGFTLNDFLNKVVRQIYEHQDFIDEIRVTGGMAKLWIGWYNLGVNTTGELEWELLRDLASLKMDLVIDVYQTNIEQES